MVITAVTMEVCATGFIAIVFPAVGMAGLDVVVVVDVFAYLEGVVMDTFAVFVSTVVAVGLVVVVCVVLVDVAVVIVTFLSSLSSI